MVVFSLAPAIGAVFGIILTSGDKTTVEEDTIMSSLQGKKKHLKPRKGK